MEIKISAQDEVTRIEITGKLDSITAPDAQEKIMPLIVPKSRLVLDMCNVSYVSSAGLRVLLMVAKKSAQEGAKTVLSGLSEEILDIMEMTGFGNMFKNYETYIEAIDNILKD